MENQDGDSFYFMIIEGGYGFSKKILICDSYSNWDDNYNVNKKMQVLLF